MLDSGSHHVVLEWIDSLRDSMLMEAVFIPFDNSQEWIYSEKRGALIRKKGGFFTIIGVSYQPSVMPDRSIDLPLINQQEIGILGFVVIQSKGNFEILFQAKAEPGNARTTQLAPSVQATESNYLQKHGGRSQPFVEYFLRKDTMVLHKSLQTEQGWRFFRKRNQNVIVRETRKFPLTGNYYWVNSRMLPALVREDDLLNSDARSVLSCLLLEQGNAILSTYSSDLAKALLLSSRSMPAVGKEIRSWYDDISRKQEFLIERKPLKELNGWVIGSDRISRLDGTMFEVKHIAINTTCREVSQWDQPIISTIKPEKITLIGKYTPEGIRFLVKCEPEPGLYRGVGVTATFLENETVDLSGEDESVKHFFAGHSGLIAHQVSVENSEEGGRFYRDTNIHEIRMYESTLPEYELPEHYRWVTLAELHYLLDAENILTNELRAVLCLLWGMLE